MKFLQKKFGDDAPMIENINEAHMACLLLLDTSSSMEGSAINELNKGINRFKKEVCKDEQTCGILDISIVSFNNSPEVIQDWVPIRNMNTIKLEAGGGTFMSPATLLAVDMVRERSRTYRELGTEPYKPWIIMISDGAPLDNIEEASNIVKDSEEKGKLKFFSLGVDGYDPVTMKKFAGEKTLALKDKDFTSFFNWVNKSMKAVSQSSPGERVNMPQVPSNVSVLSIDI